jgi:hypothetical protein
MLQIGEYCLLIDPYLVTIRAPAILFDPIEYVHVKDCCPVTKMKKWGGPTNGRNAQQT